VAYTPFEADLHMHTTSSRDGTIEPRVLVDTAVGLGLFAVAVTDHNTTAAVKRVREMAKGRDLLVISGVEVSSTDGHVLALGVDEAVPRGLDAAETLRRIEDLGGLAVAAHPGRVYSGLHPDDVGPAGFKVVEVANGHSSVGLNRDARALATRLGAARTGGSDAHQPREIGQCRTVFKTAPPDAQGVLEAIRRRETTAVGDGLSWRRELKLNVRMAARWVARGGRRM
jgi:predicted metal-dependent phosphoesterase TrpH